MPKKYRDPAILNPAADTAEGITEIRRQEALLKTGALQSATLNSANFSSIATDVKGVSRYSPLAPSACWATRPPK
ncbi:hypothetical protein [Sulfuricella sp.]|uniref:hypothetical protein n=1 Tax=Sulfuricella sp. TaxID=2099377 RepID=UPI002C57D532|nr:hypothetical protein [Sulfuricella sp.]HUX65188.1 hypothetical protein [Sulfuricella sp.]